MLCSTLFLLSKMQFRRSSDVCWWCTFESNYRVKVRQNNNKKSDHFRIWLMYSNWSIILDLIPNEGVIQKHINSRDSQSSREYKRKGLKGLVWEERESILQFARHFRWISFKIFTFSFSEKRDQRINSKDWATKWLKRKIETLEWRILEGNKCNAGASFVIVSWKREL